MSFETEIYSLRPRLYKFAYRLVKNTDGAEDLVQNTFARAVQCKHQFKEGTNLAAWLCTILRNDFYSAGRRAGRMVEDPDGSYTERLVSIPNQIDSLYLSEVWAEIHQLPEHMQETLLLVTVEGLSNEAAASQLNVRVGTVKSRVSRARKILQEKLNHDNFRDHSY